MIFYCGYYDHSDDADDITSNGNDNSHDDDRATERGQGYKVPHGLKVKVPHNTQRLKVLGVS